METARMTVLVMESYIALPTWVAWVVGGVLVVAIVCGFIVALRRWR
jgi:hypothetical protein